MAWTRRSLVGDRFRLTERLDASPVHSVWVGVDTRTGAQVHVLRVEAPTIGAVLDAATKAGVIEDPRIPNTLAVIPPTAEQRSGFVITAAAHGRSLEDLISSGGPVSAPRLRGIVGETAQALAAAEQVGVHHGRLRPHHVLVADDGSVQVRGLGTEGVLATLAWEQGGSDDARALAGLLYAGMTGTWPLPPSPAEPDQQALIEAEVTDGQWQAPVDEVHLPGAPLLHGVPAHADDIAPDADRELSDLCAQMFTQPPTGPGTAADMAAALAPWTTAEAQVDAASPGQPMLDETLVSDRSAFAPEHEPELEPEAESVAPQPESSVAVAVPAPEPPAPVVPPAAAVAKPPAPFARPSGTTPVAATVTSGPTVGTSPPAGTTQPSTSTTQPSTTRVAAASTAEERAFSRAGAAAGAAAAAAASRVGAVAVEVRDSAAVRGAQVRTLRFAGRLHPDIPALTQEEKRGRTAVVIGVLASLLVVGLVAAVLNLRNFGAATATSVVSPTPSATASTTATATATAVVKPVIASIAPLDPLGDSVENNAQIGALTDNNPATLWNSSTYGSAAFGGVKTGLGLLITLKQAAPVKAVAIDQAGTSGQLEVRNAPKGSYEGSTVIAKAQAFAAPTTTVSIAKSGNVKQLLIWFTQLPQTQGRYRLELSALRVS